MNAILPFLILLMTPGMQDAPKEQKPLKIGVVNLKHCFDKDRYERIQALDVELQALAAEYAKGVEATRKKIENIRMQLEGLTPELKSYWDKANELKQAEAELEFKRKYGKQQYLGRLVGLQVEVYTEITRIVEIYAKEKGYDLILRVDEPNLDKEKDLNSISQRISSRVILYHSATVDVTDAIVDLLNQEYLKKKAAEKK
jgi:Skp family chaperone for outer membrane proteins|tara:strand:- start:503 stop:1102 length:600 start_codon:yes stop_codon:yes gene_type:complete